MNSDRMYLDCLWLFSTGWLFSGFGFFFHNLELCFVFTQLIWIKYLLLLPEKNNFETVVWILGFILFSAVKNHEVVSMPSSTEKEWIRLVFCPLCLLSCVYLLPLMGIIMFINLLNTILVILKSFYVINTPSVNTDGVLLDMHNNLIITNKC